MPQVSALLLSEEATQPSKWSRQKYHVHSDSHVRVDHLGLNHAKILGNQQKKPEEMTVMTSGMRP